MAMVSGEATLLFFLFTHSLCYIYFSQFIHHILFNVSANQNLYQERNLLFLPFYLSFFHPFSIKVNYIRADLIFYEQLFLSAAYSIIDGLRCP